MSDSPFDTTTPAGSLLAGLAERFPGAEFASSLGDQVVRLAREDLAAFAAAARDAGLDTFIDLCAVDYLSRAEGRFEVVVHLLSFEARLRLRIQAAVPGDDPRAPSLTAVFPGANFYEREAYDLFGIRFDGHPDLTRLLLPDDWEGHPLRKDHPMGSVPVQFKAIEGTP
ncbi:MAG: NADH-quinone oxidoreductase subunit C [Acidimicrobiia bacterium]|jgi:NADH-quinone oxidoreductase subunit C|nr:NADH-quinone oxidoreductase subunit C [Acidimicrobiia bacterium]